MSYKRLGDYIQLVNNKNKDLTVTNLLGVSIQKKFIPSIANKIVGFYLFKTGRLAKFGDVLVSGLKIGLLPIVVI
jgi:type I restriction enzyme S subunit